MQPCRHTDTGIGLHYLLRDAKAWEMMTEESGNTRKTCDKREKFTHRSVSCCSGNTYTLCHTCCSDCSLKTDGVCNKIIWMGLFIRTGCWRRVEVQQIWLGSVLVIKKNPPVYWRNDVFSDLKGVLMPGLVKSGHGCVEYQYKVFKYFMQNKFSIVVYILFNGNSDNVLLMHGMIPVCRHNAVPRHTIQMHMTVFTSCQLLCWCYRIRFLNKTCEDSWF